MPKAKKAVLPYHFTGTPAVKDAIEAIGVPHVEVEAILINNHPVLFYHSILDRDTIVVYPCREPLRLPHDYVLRAAPPVPARFVLDVHLGALAKKLRLLGFDAVYENDFSDNTIAHIAATEQRIVLTRDIGLLKHRSIIWGRWLRSQLTDEQLVEVIKHFRLLQQSNPFTRCLACNGIIIMVKKESIKDKIPPKANTFFHDFFQCIECKRVYWKGSHYDRMEQTIAQIKSSLQETDSTILSTSI